jgi:pyruvate formate lyase activating enzyme
VEKSPLIGGVVPLTTIDYPGHLAAVIFFQGCPWRCRYCQNRHLLSILPTESLPWEDILSLLDMRKGFVEAAVFSGGEPLVQEVLADAIEDVKKLGFKIGLHTTGAFPDRFERVLPLLDWVGFDVKHVFRKYSEITGVEGSGTAACQSLEALISSGVDCEVRTTVCRTLDASAILEILKEISNMGVKKAVLQKCRDENDNVVEHTIFSDKLFLENASKYFDDFCVRR